MNSIEIFPKKILNALGSHFAKSLPKKWYKVKIFIERNEEKVSYEGTYFYKCEVDNKTYNETFQLDYISIKNLKELRIALSDTFIETWDNWHIVFHKNGKFEWGYDDEVNISTKIKQYNFNEIKENINKLGRINLSEVTIDTLRESISNWLIGFMRTSPIIPKGKKLFRAVKWMTKPEIIDQLSYPPSDKIKKFQRVNRPNQSMFYCSTSREGAFFEIFPKIGEYIAISTWITNTSLLVNNVGYTRKIFKELESRRKCPKWSELRLNEEQKKINDLIGNFLSKEFTKVVQNGKEYLYKISIAIAEQHIQSNMFVGLIYPSIGMRANADNLAIKPKFVDKYISFEHVEYIYIEKKEKDFEYKIKILDFANSYSDERKIEWKGRLPHWVLRQQGEMLTFTVEDGKWVARNSRGKIIEPE